MVLLEIFIASNFKKFKKNRFIAPIIKIAQDIDPDKTLRKLQRGNINGKNKKK